MWCSTCQQDVSACVPGPEGGNACAKCAGALPAQACAAVSITAAIASPERPALLSPRAAAPILDDDWTLEADLHSVERLVQTLKATGPKIGDSVEIHAAHDFRATQPHFPQRTAGGPASAAGATSVATLPRSNSFAWTLLSPGLAAFACGAVLLGWSIVGNRQDLWPIGMPLTLIGQAGLILGLVWQLDGLWQSSRKTVTTLQELDSELAQVRSAAVLLSANKATPGQSFYAHMAEGVSPHMLLADLKGQLDVLSQQMNRR